MAGTAGAGPSPAATLPTVLVLLASYNGAAWLPEQLASILDQRDVAVRVLIGDDRSKDNTLALLADTWANDARVTVRAWDSASGSAGGNFRRLYVQADLQGVDFVALADQDDVWLPSKLAAAVGALNDSQASGYSCAVRAFWPDGREKTLAQNPRIRAADFLFEGAGQGCSFVLSAPLFARVQALCIAAPDLVSALHYHDWLIYLLARAWGETWYFDPQPGMRYRQHANNEIGARGGAGAVMRRIGMIRNGWYRKQVKAAIAIYRFAGGAHAVPFAISALMQHPTSLGRVRLMACVLRHGRRSQADRAILALAALAGWI